MGIAAATHITPEVTEVTEVTEVILMDPGNTYALSNRATKFGLLFIGLTFWQWVLYEL